MFKIIFEDKLDPIECSEVESNVSVYYTSEPSVNLYNGSVYYRNISHNSTTYSICISKDDKNRIRGGLFRIINNSNKILYSNCCIYKTTTENDLIKIYFRPLHNPNFRRQQTIMFGTSNLPENGHIRFLIR